MVQAARDIKDKLEALQVLEVEISGDREEVLEILIDAAAMEAYGLIQMWLLVWSAATSWSPPARSMMVVGVFSESPRCHRNYR